MSAALDQLRQESGAVITREQVERLCEVMQHVTVASNGAIYVGRDIANDDVEVLMRTAVRCLDVAECWLAWQECDAEARKETIEDLRDLLERMEYGVEHGEGGAPAACRPHRDALRAALALLGDDAAKDAG